MARAKPAPKRARTRPRPAGSPPGKAPSIDPALAARQLARVRAAMKSLPGVTERLSHGAPTFFLDGAKHSFVMFVDNHHHDGRLALWCAAEEGAQAMLIDANPDAYFVPPYVGPSGWIGVRLDRELPASEIGAVIAAAHAARAARARAPRARAKAARSR